MISSAQLSSRGGLAFAGPLRAQAIKSCLMALGDAEKAAVKGFLGTHHGRTLACTCSEPPERVSATGPNMRILVCTNVHEVYMACVGPVWVRRARAPFDALPARLVMSRWATEMAGVTVLEEASDAVRARRGCMLS